MKAASILADIQKLVQVEEKNPARLSSDDITEQLFAWNGSVILRKDPALFDMAEDVAAPPVEVNDDVDASGLHHADFMNRIPGSENQLVFLIGFFMCPEA